MRKRFGSRDAQTVQYGKFEIPNGKFRVGKWEKLDDAIVAVQLWAVCGYNEPGVNFYVNPDGTIGVN